MPLDKIKKSLIANAVSHLNLYGYTDCNTCNIITNKEYSDLFTNMLIANKGQGYSIDCAINELLCDIQEAHTLHPVIVETTSIQDTIKQYTVVGYQ